MKGAGTRARHSVRRLHSAHQNHCAQRPCRRSGCCSKGVDGHVTYTCGTETGGQDRLGHAKTGEQSASPGDRRSRHRGPGVGASFRAGTEKCRLEPSGPRVREAGPGTSQGLPRGLCPACSVYIPGSHWAQTLTFVSTLRAAPPQVTLPPHLQ